jgi:putative aldouronate transport system permease protein
MTLVLVVMVFPFLYVINYSLSDPSQVSGKFLIYPINPTFDSYVTLLKDPTIWNGVFISVARTVLGTVIMIFFTSMAGYVLTRDDFMGVKFFRRFFIITLYFSSGIIPMYLLIQGLGLTSSFWVYVIPSAVNVFNMILIKTYIESIPKELEEAALIDGANDLYLFFKIMFPISMPVIAAVSLFAAIGQWNSFIDTQFYNAMNPELFPLQYVLYNSLQTITNIEQYQFEKSPNITPQSLKMAMTVVTVLPIMLVYPFLQKYFMKGLLIGSIKG